MMKPKQDDRASRTSVDLDSADAYACAAVLLTVISRQLYMHAEQDKAKGVIERERLVEIQRMTAGLRSYAQGLYGS